MLLVTDSIKNVYFEKVKAIRYYLLLHSFKHIDYSALEKFNEYTLFFTTPSSLLYFLCIIDYALKYNKKLTLVLSAQINLDFLKRFKSFKKSIIFK